MLEFSESWLNFPPNCPYQGNPLAEFWPPKLCCLFVVTIGTRHSETDRWARLKFLPRLEKDIPYGAPRLKLCSFSMPNLTNEALNGIMLGLFCGVNSARIKRINLRGLNVIFTDSRFPRRRSAYPHLWSAPTDPFRVPENQMRFCFINTQSKRCGKEKWWKDIPLILERNHVDCNLVVAFLFIDSLHLQQFCACCLFTYIHYERISIITRIFNLWIRFAHASMSWL